MGETGPVALAELISRPSVLSSSLRGSGRFSGHLPNALYGNVSFSIRPQRTPPLRPALTLLLLDCPCLLHRVPHLKKSLEPSSCGCQQKSLRWHLLIYLYPNLPSPPERETQREWTPSCHSRSGQSNNSALSAFADFPLDTEMSADTSPFVLTARPLPASSRLAWSLHGHSRPHQPKVLPALLPGDWDQESQCHRISHYPGTGLFSFLSAGASDPLLAGVMGHEPVQPDIGYSEVLAYVVGGDFCPAERPTAGDSAD